MGNLRSKKCPDFSHGFESRKESDLQKRKRESKRFKQFHLYIDPNDYLKMKQGDHLFFDVICSDDKIIILPSKRGCFLFFGRWQV
jgi:hypothetical protein